MEQKLTQVFNPRVTNGLYHPYQLDESTFVKRGVRRNCSFFDEKFKRANRIAQDGTPRFAASHLRLFCLPLSHKKDARLIWVNWRPCTFHGFTAHTDQTGQKTGFHMSSSVFPTKLNVNRSAQLFKQAKVMKFWLRTLDVLYYLDNSQPRR